MDKIYNKFVEKTYLKYPKSTNYLTPKLRSINIGLTGSCNLKCSMCFCNRNNNKFIEPELFMKLVNEIKGQGIVLGLTFAGESLLHPLFDEFVYTTKSFGIKTGLSTNGMLIHKHLDALSLINNLSISIDGLPPINESIRIGSDTKLIEKNVSLLMKQSFRPKIDVTMTVTTQTQTDVNDFVSYWINKVDSVRIKPAFNIDGEYYKTCLTKSNRIWPYCPFLNNYLGVLYTGEITICCIDLTGEQTFANLKNINVFEAWNSKHLKELRYKFLVKDLPKKSLCYRCQVWPTYNNIIEYKR